MEEKTILVTGIGGNVGQGILRNLKDGFSEFQLIGTDIASFTAGNYLCDRTYKIPYSYEPEFLQEIKEIIENEEVDLIIPSTDYEVYYLSKFRDEIGCPVACIDISMSSVFLNKMNTYLFFKKNNIPFAESQEVKDFAPSKEPFIVKPKEGRGSRGIYINPSDLSTFDESFMVQKLYEGKEYTTTVYVNQKGEIHAIITMERRLENGTTVFAKVVDDHKEEILNLSEQIVKSGDIKGSLNIQSIYENRIVPFEINGRISGTNSIRHVLGFQDCIWTVKELLFNEKLEKPNISNGIATRILLDTVYVNATQESETINTNYPYIQH